jgi:predicted NUDIX family phosphoesterase
MNKDEMKVLVVNSESLFPSGIWEGFKEFKKEEIFALIKKHGKYLKRKYAEEDTSWQQIIPQIVLIVGKKIFIHRIPQTGDEGRLYEMWHIFVGGHINNSDTGIDEAAQREFEEEINYLGNINKKSFMGVVKLGSPEVNSVHTGLVWIYEGDKARFTATEDKGLIDSKFVNIKDLEKYIDKMTYWSKLVAPCIIEKYK